MGIFVEPEDSRSAAACRRRAFSEKPTEEERWVRESVEDVVVVDSESEGESEDESGISVSCCVVCVVCEGCWGRSGGADDDDEVVWFAFVVVL